MTDIKERLRRLSYSWGDMSPAPAALAEIERLEAGYAGIEAAIDEILAERDALRASNERLKSAAIAANEEICQTLGAVLGYPWFKDSPEIFPNASEADGVCVGPDTAETLAQAAAARIKTLQASNERMEAALRVLVRFAEKNECHHEDVYRGMVWTFCHACGRKWADDKGGFQAYRAPKEIVQAREALAALDADKPVCRTCNDHHRIIHETYQITVDCPDCTDKEASNGNP